MKKKIEIEIIDKKQISETEPERQYYFMDIAKAYVAQLAEKKGAPLTFHVTTFGCQMNARDSEKLVGILERVGYVETATEEADFVIYNTCTVRENANNKVYGRLGVLQNYKKKNPHMMIGLCGCMMQEPSVVEKLKESYRFVDLVFGTHNIYKFAELLVTAMESTSMTIDIWKDTDKIVEDLPVERKYSFKSGVNIMFGCNNFCSYCIVPYVRGRERSREPKEILREIEALVADGVVEVMLLGQNVNSYGRNLEHPVTFAQLLQEIEKIEGLERIRFMTSHPKDLSDELIEVMKNSTKICKHLHLPLQSGSSRILKIMNRHYDKEHYLELVDKLRAAVPDIALTTDIIVGFPGETEEDFEETLDVVRRVRYDSAFTFIYSKRTGTPAAAMEEQIPEEIVKERFDRLLKEVQRISAEKAGVLTGQTLPVLIEEVNEQDGTLVTGRLSNNSIVHLPGTARHDRKDLSCEAFRVQGLLLCGKGRGGIMYAYIKGILTDMSEDTVVVEAGGIGYNIHTTGQTFDYLPSVGEEVKLYTYLNVREDAMVLYGFLTKDDLRVFKLLLGVSGIGPKGALAILSVMTTDDLRFAVLGEDAKAIARAPGVGAKTAQRLILELKDKFSLEDAFEQKLAHTNEATAEGMKGVKNEAVAALVALGYSSSEALQAIGKVEITEGADVEDVLKAALKNMAFM